MPFTKQTYVSCVRLDYLKQTFHLKFCVIFLKEITIQLIRLSKRAISCKIYRKLQKEIRDYDNLRNSNTIFENSVFILVDMVQLR